MPYIKEERRRSAVSAPDDAGELNYAVTRLVCGYIERKGLHYATINDVLGALDGAGKEFYRRVAAPYEDKRSEENGDVYPESMTLRAL